MYLSQSWNGKWQKSIWENGRAHLLKVSRGEKDLLAHGAIANLHPQISSDRFILDIAENKGSEACGQVIVNNFDSLWGIFQKQWPGCMDFVR